MKSKTRNRLINATAVMAVMIVPLSMVLMTTEYWVMGFSFLSFALFWLGCYGHVNFNKFVDSLEKDPSPKTEVTTKSN